MCLGIPGEVIELMADHPDLAMVRIENVERAVNVGLLRADADSPLDLSPGDWILIHMGFALERIDEKEARSSLEFVTGVSDTFSDRHAR